MIRACIILCIIAAPLAAHADNWITNGDFVAWSGDRVKVTCSDGHVSADGISLGPGLGGCVASWRDAPCSGDGSDGFCLFAQFWGTIWGGHDPRTERLTILEHHIPDHGMLDGATVRLSFNVFTPGTDMGLIPILWQNWRENVYQIYTCAPIEGAHLTWVHVECDMVLPHTTGIRRKGNYVGVGIDALRPTGGLMILDDLRLKRL